MTSLIHTLLSFLRRITRSLRQPTSVEEYYWKERQTPESIPCIKKIDAEKRQKTRNKRKTLQTQRGGDAYSGMPIWELEQELMGLLEEVEDCQEPGKDRWICLIKRKVELKSGYDGVGIKQVRF